MPLQTGFHFSFFAACKPDYKNKELQTYPIRADGYFTMNPLSLPLLLKTNAVQNLSPAYYETLEQSLNYLEKFRPYSDELCSCSHLVFTYKGTPILVFENLSIANSDWILKIDFSYLVPHWVSSENLKNRTRAEKRLTVLSLLGLFLGYGLLK